METKYARIGARRKLKTKELIGGLILQMYRQKKYKVQNIERLRKIIGVSFESMHKNIGFLIKKENGKAYIELEKRHIEIIKKTEATVEELKNIEGEDRKIAELVFVNLWQNARK